MLYSRYLKLRNDIEKYNKAYYNEDRPLISDLEYDNLYRELKQIEKEHPEFLRIFDSASPTQKIGGNVNEKFSKIKHQTPMLSLDNTYNITDIEDFATRIKKTVGENYPLEYILELKLDGVSISLIYENGELVKGITRGDGIFGEDVTDNIKEITSIPKRLSKKINLEVRGEIVLPLSSFERLNKSREGSGENLFANTRNAAAGTIRQLDSTVVRERRLECYIYYLINYQDFGFTTHSDSINFLQDLGFKTTNVFEKHENLTTLFESINRWNQERKKLDFETDGMVIKLNNFHTYSLLGNTVKSPRWAIAYKFPTEQIQTKIKNVIFQIGRTGTITPVAEFEPVSLSGSIIKRASLHNFDEIKRKDIRIGDVVIIEKAAEIIPYVVNVVFGKRTGEEKIINIPLTCPNCGSSLVQEGVAIKCTNPTCSEKIKRKIEHFVSRDAMNIIGMGEKIIDVLVNQGYIKSFEDIYELKKYKSEIENLDNMGSQKVNNLLQNIENSKSQPYSKVLYALGIPYIGRHISEILVRAYKTIDELKLQTFENIINIPGIGETVAKSICDYLNKDAYWKIIEHLKEHGLCFSYIENEIEDNSIKGYSFLVTGKLNEYRREELKNIISNRGGIYLSSVNKNLDYLITNETSNNKINLAQKLGVQIINEQEFKKLFL